MEKAMSNNENRPPRWISKLVDGITWANCASILMIVIIIALGLTNPFKPGQPFVSDHLVDVSNWSLASIDDSANIYRNFQSVKIANGGGTYFLTVPYVLHPPASVEITLKQTNGPDSVESGIWWQASGVDRKTILAFKADGYLRLFQTSGIDTGIILDWHEFPHIVGRGHPDTVRMDIDNARISLRLNDELVAENIPAIFQSFSVGLYFFSAGMSEFEIEVLDIWESH
jgi:hypothetical protein